MMTVYSDGVETIACKCVIFLQGKDKVSSNYFEEMKDIIIGTIKIHIAVIPDFTVETLGEI